MLLFAFTDILDAVVEVENYLFIKDLIEQTRGAIFVSIGETGGAIQNWAAHTRTRTLHPLLQGLSVDRVRQRLGYC